MSEPKKIIRRKISRNGKTGQKANYYFNDDTQASIMEYKGETDLLKKNVIYTKGILSAFTSLVENLINVYGFSVAHESKIDLRHECVTFLYAMIHKFNPEKGPRAFAYFNVVAKNWLTIRSKMNVRRVQSYISLDDVDSITQQDAEILEQFNVSPSHENFSGKERLTENVEKVLREIRQRVLMEQELSVIDCILNLFQDLDNIDLLSKRHVMLYVKEMTGLQQKQLSQIVSVLKKYYREIKKEDTFALFE
jgi:hypothetical protein